VAEKMWANSGDAHVLEQNSLWQRTMPPEMAARMPRSEKLDDVTEMIHVDGRSFKRRMPRNPLVTEADALAIGRPAREVEAARESELHFLDHISDVERAPGAWDVQIRMQDLDHEGIWGEVVYPSIGLWNGLIRDPVLYREGVKVMNDWLKATFIDVTKRSIPAAEISILSVDDAVAEAKRVAELGFRALSIPPSLGGGVPNWNDISWEPLWSIAEEANLVLGIHIAGDFKDVGQDGFMDMADGYRGLGGAILNYVDTTYGGQQAAAMLVASGALDRHPGLKVLVSEGGATWVPFIADRMEEAYRQHGPYVRPKLKRPPRQILFEQVYASFQHDKTAVQAYLAMGYKNVMWGSDYPHHEGTFGHTQATLHELFDDVPDKSDVYRMTRGAFLDLFPEVGEPPAEEQLVSNAATTA